MRKPVIIESPFAGDIHRNKYYAKRCMLDSIERGEAPMVSHLLYTQVLDDGIMEQRRAGIDCGFAWRHKDIVTVVYDDYEISMGMMAGITHALEIGSEVKYRSIGKNTPANDMVQRRNCGMLFDRGRA
jgi:hypothetical protein